MEFRILIAFGPLIKIMGLMMNKLVQVMLIYLYILFMFTQLAECYLYGQEGFVGMQESFITLMHYSLGEIEFSLVSNTPRGYLSLAFLIVFSMFNLILLLNLIIALLTSIYS